MQAAWALNILSANDVENQVKSVFAGAIPLLVELLGPEKSAEVHKQALSALLKFIGNVDGKVKAESAGAKAALKGLILSSSDSQVKQQAGHDLNLLIN